MRFVGLSDSVGAFLLPGNSAEGFVNPYLSPTSAEFVYQLTARNEIRKNFPLTRITPAGAWKEEEIFGAHSDVGDGYDNTPEQIHLTGADVRYSGPEKWSQKAAWAREMKRGLPLTFLHHFGNRPTFGTTQQKSLRHRGGFFFGLSLLTATIHHLKLTSRFPRKSSKDG